MIPAIRLIFLLAHQCQMPVAWQTPIQSSAAHSHHDSQLLGGYRAPFDHNGEEDQDVINGEIADNGQVEVVDNSQVVDSGGGSEEEFTISASGGLQDQIQEPKYPMRFKNTRKATKGLQTTEAGDEQTT